MSTTPQNPIAQFTPQGQAPQPQKLQTEEPKKGHTIWWIMGSCCAIAIIVLIALAVLGFAYRGRVGDYLKSFGNTTENTAPNVTSQNSVVQNTTNNSSSNTTNTTNNSTPSTNSTNNTTTGTGTNPPGTGSGQKNVVVSTVTAKGIDAKNGSAKDATSSFSVDDDIYYVVLEVSNLEATDISVDWYQNDEKVQTYSLKNASGNKFINFYLDVSGSDADARVGDYQAKIYFGTELKKTLSFSVSK